MRMISGRLMMTIMIVITVGGGVLMESQAQTTAAGDSCGSNLNMNGLGILFDTSSLSCLPVWDSQNFILRYGQASPTVWSFVLSAPTTTAYIAMGFSSDGQMVGSSAVVGWTSSASGSSSPSIKQYALNGQSRSQVKVEQGNLPLIGNSTVITAQNNRTFMAFQLNTTQPQSRIIYAVGPPDFTPVGPNFDLTEHQYRVSTTINYVSGKTATGGTPYTSLKKSHGLLNMIAWGILMIIGAMVARYFRDLDPIWFYAHTGIQSIAFVLGLIGVITGLVLQNRVRANVSKHKGLGIFIFLLGCLQVVAVFISPDKSSKVRKYWNWYHHNVGRIVVIFAVANIFYGIHLGEKGNGWKAGYGVVLALLIITLIALEVRMFMRRS